MIDYVRVREGEEEAFIQRAETLGYKELVLVYDKDFKQKDFDTTLKIRFGKIGKKGCEEEIVLGTSLEKIPKTATALIDNEYEEKGDFAHQRRGGLNHVILKDCKERGVKILFDYGYLQGLSIQKQQQYLGRIQQNLFLCKKFSVDYFFVSFASKVSQMRDPKDVACMERVLS